MKDHGTRHTEQPKAPPKVTNMKPHTTSWPAEGEDVGLKQSKQSGKNRERKSFKPGSQW